MRKITIMLAVFSLILAAFPAMAKQEKEILPEVEGVYDVPGHPEMKLRVFVYKAKPIQAPAPSLACNLTDPQSTAQVSGAGWKLPSNWVYRLNPSSVPSSVGSQNLSTIAARSFSVWASATGNQIIATPGGPTSVTRAVRDGQNIITWGRTSGSALAVTYTWYNTSTGLAVEIDTIMNQKFPWSWTNQQGANQFCAYSNTYDAQNILTHELGHTFGLNDHYSADYVNNTMYGYGSKTEVKKNTLTTGDVNGVKALYQ